jgi:hypothetical protein
MPIDVSVGTPLAEALQNVVLPKLVEVGWSTGMQDDTLSEYIILMLANGKAQDQIASELSNDLLDLGPDDQGAVEFAKWLFEQVQILAVKFNVADDASDANGGAADGHGDIAIGDADMVEGADGSPSTMYASTRRSIPQLKYVLTRYPRPTGPKAMRNGKTRDKRMLGQLNKSLERGTDPLHRVRGAAGVGRINSHSRGDVPKGPRQQQIQRGLAAGNGRPMQGMPGMAPIMPHMGGMPPNGAHFQQQQAQQPGMIAMQPQQLQHMLQMMEEQANMMAQLSQGMGGFPGQGQGRFQQSQHQNGRPLSDRVERRGRQGQDRRQQNQGAQQTQAPQDVAMGEDGEPKNGEAAEDSEKGQKDVAETMCKFNQTCTRVDCPFAHAGPYSIPHIAVDTSVECSFGVRCKNKNCASRHPSPAKKYDEMTKADCRFGANCTNDFCAFKHPEKPACRNGADCTVPECQFWHNPQMCKYTDGCTYAQCPFKHAEGQKKVRGKVTNKVWTPNGVNGQEHVSERKFVEDEDVEEQIIPGRTEAESGMEVM